MIHGRNVVHADYYMGVYAKSLSIQYGFKGCGFAPIIKVVVNSGFMDGHQKRSIFATTTLVIALAVDSHAIGTASRSNNQTDKTGITSNKMSSEGDNPLLHLSL